MNYTFIDWVSVIGFAIIITAVLVVIILASVPKTINIKCALPEFMTPKLNREVVAITSDTPIIIDDNPHVAINEERRRWYNQTIAKRLGHHWYDDVHVMD